MVAPAHAGDVPPGTPPRARGRWWPAVPAVLALAAAAALFLPWWRAGAGPVLLGGGPLRVLAPDSWTGIEVAGLRAVLVGGLALLATVTGAVGVVDGRRTGGRACAAAAGAAAVACGAAALVGWGPTAAAGAWFAVATGAGAVACAVWRGTVRAPLVLAVTLAAAAAVVAVPGGEQVPDRSAAAPFQRVAALGAWRPARSGAAGLPGRGDARPVVVDGAPGVVAAEGVITADARGRARVLARTDDGAPPPLGVAAGRVVRWITADTLAVTGLRPDGPLQVVVRDVGAASTLGDDGSVWLRSDIDPPEAVRRLDLAAYDGRQDLSATYLPVVTIQDPDGEGPVDVHDVRPVPGGALRIDDAGDPRRLQLLTATPGGIAVRTLLDTSASRCASSTITTVGDLGIVTADATGVWFPTADRRLAHRDVDGTVRLVPARLPGLLSALAAPGDGSVLFIARADRDDAGTALWRLPDAAAALAGPPAC
jgi:hypothetical protein